MGCRWYHGRQANGRSQRVERAHERGGGGAEGGVEVGGDTGRKGH